MYDYWTDSHQQLSGLTATDNIAKLSDLIISEMPAIVCGLDSNGAVLFLNPAGEKVTGYQSEELAGRNWWRIFYPGEEYQQVERLLPILKQGNVADYDMVLTTRNGEKRIISWSSISLRRENGTVSNIGFGIDITGRKQAEESLRLHKVQLQVILESTADGILAVDTDGRTITANRRFADLWKIPDHVMASGDDETMIAHVLDQLVDPSAFTERVRQLYSSTDSDMDVLYFKDGRIYERYSAPLLVKDTLVGRVWSFRDITKRRRAEEELQKSEEQYRLLTEISPNAITVADPSGRVRMVNRRALDMFGFDNDSEVLGQSLFEWVAADYRDLAMQTFGEFLVSGSVSNLELRLLRRDGSHYWGLTNASLIRTPEGEPHLAIILTADITQQKQLEEERLKLQKLESVGVLAGGIAHDFNNLLQGVFGYISMARGNSDCGPLTAELLTQAEQALKLSINLTTQLLTFAKGGQPVRKQFHPIAIVENMARFALSGSRSSYTIATGEQILPVTADEGQIGQIIQNIVLNAREAMPDGGTVAISLTNVTLARAAHASLPAGGKFVRIDIRDEGIGIPERYLSRIFDPYFTTKQKGSGLGLATAFAIARNHGGTLEVTSAAGQGSTFSLFLPADDLATQLTHPPADTAAGRKGKILVMDDEEIIRLVVTRMVRLLGHTAVSCQEGEEAIARFCQARGEGTPFDAVILDLTVKGGVGGEEVCRRLRTIDPQVRIIVSSGYTDNPVLSDHQAYGFTAYLVKPYTIEALREVLTRAMP